MKLINDEKQFAIQTDNYKLTFGQDRPFVFVDDFQGERIMELFYLSSIDPLNGRDDTIRVGSWEKEESDNKIIFTLEADSSVWEKKIYRFTCKEERFSYDIEVKGNGYLTDVNYFGGYYSANTRWGSGFFYSGQNFEQIFNPEPNTAERNYFPPEAGSIIDLMGVPVPGKGDWFFTPPPFCFAAKGKNNWISMGVEAKPGENSFTEYSYHGQLGFHLSLSYEGHTSVEDSYRLPAIGFDFAKDEYAALKAHVKALEDAGYVKINRNKENPEWWYQPIYCGWGSQCYVAATEKGHAPDYARQSLYEDFMKTLNENDVTPGIIVLDDKWQKTYGENRVDTDKWPDLRGFIEQQHQEGKRVLLWLKAWDAEGLPADECITNAAGLPLTFDPSNPVFEKRLRESVRNMLSADGYNADGFKIDFSARIPSGPNINTHGDSWGLELMKLYLGILYDQAKKTKDDALIMSHTPHPYLAEVLDMIRLNDINTGKDVNKAMTHRANVASTACPDAVIDTDNWPITDKDTWREYIKLQPELGVPSFYFASHIDSTKEALEEEDYQLLRDMWQKYRDKFSKEK